MQRVQALLRITALGLAGVALLSALFAQGGRWSPELDILTHVAPVYLAVALMALALALAGRARAGTLALALVAILVAGLLVAPEYVRDAGPRASAHASGRLKIVQFNAWSSNAASDRAIAWVLRERPDVIVLQEGRTLRARLIAAGYKAACNGCSPVILALSRPLRRFPPRGVWDDRSRFAYATYRDVRGEFTVVAVHGHWPTKIEAIQAQRAKLLAHMDGWPRDRMILAGDFNSTPWSFARQRDDRELGLIRRTRALFSWPAGKLSHNRLPAPFPYLPIDHVYAGPGWATVKVERGPALGSDHYPVVVTLAPVAGAGT